MSMDHKNEVSGGIHIYGQYQWHDDAFIVGDRDSLIALRNAIDKAIKGDKAGLDTFTNDGEGYTINIVVTPGDFFGTLKVPYSMETTWEWGGVHPSELTLETRRVFVTQDEAGEVVEIERDDDLAVQWFGDKPWGRICKSTKKAETPVGQKCNYCDEEIKEGDIGVLMWHFPGDAAPYRQPRHQQCLLKEIGQ